MNHPLHRYTRRTVLLAGAEAAFLGSVTGQASAGDAEETLRRVLKPYVLDSATIDQFLDAKSRNWAKFHPTYGYLLRNSFVRDGQDGSHTLARYEATGQRKQVNFPDEPCRINTYGDSFTQGHQVSDGETWQEMLAAHFCEPIRNFGIGGFGVYQAARRLIDVESTELGATHLIFNLWGDDHFRSIYSWRGLARPPHAVAAISGAMFHSNPWVHARLDPATGELIDRPNLCPDEATLRKLCDLDFVVETFGRDEIMQALIASREGVVIDRGVLEKLARQMGDDSADWSTPESIRPSAFRLLHRYGLRVGMKVVERVNEFSKARGKKLMVLLSYPAGSVLNACAGRTRYNHTDHVDWHPQEFKDFLAQHKIPSVDSLEKHLAEFRTFRLSPNKYVSRYYIGHYNPSGNSFFAYGIKDELLKWLDPVPPSYRTDGEPLIRFQGYLPG